MPKFRLTTVERWEHKVCYPPFEADSLADAMHQLHERSHAYDHHEIIEEGDEIIRLWEAEEDGKEITVPDEWGADMEHPPAPQMPKIMAYVEGGCIQGVRSTTPINLIVIDVDDLCSEGRDDDLGRLTEEYEALKYAVL